MTDTTDSETLEPAGEPFAVPSYGPPTLDEPAAVVPVASNFREVEETLAEVSENKINIALYHVERIRQMLPDLSEWSEERAAAINEAIALMEAAIKGREGDDQTYRGLRETVAAAAKNPRDIDVMIALSDRATDIEDLLTAHDKYSIGIRNSLIALKPLAVEYVRVPKRRAPGRRSTPAGSRPSKSRTTAKSKSSEANSEKQDSPT